jgi:hypothetical protein
VSRLSDNRSISNAEASVELSASSCPAGAAALDDLSRQLATWSHLWSGPVNDADAGGKHRLVRERLLAWLERCIGRSASGLVSCQADELSLEVSTPLLVALLGRRATRELSRHVLRDL